MQAGGGEMYFGYGETEFQYLRSRDKRMGEVIDRVGMIRREVDPDLFAAVVHHIVGQQISTKAQATVWRRMQEALGTVDAGSVLAAGPEGLQALGISGRKAAYITDFALRVQSGAFDPEMVRESGDAEALLATAQTLLSPELVPLLKQELAGGASFPAARQRALERLGAPGAALLERPNSILAVEYCKALLRRGSRMRPIVLHRAGDYHGGSAADAPSASFLRGQVDWAGYMPEAARAVQAAAPRYRLAAGERAVLARLRAMGEDEFAALPYGSEGLWQKVMHACRTEASLEGILAAAKSKRYPRTRLMRMLLCAFLGLTEQQLTEPAPYVRVLALDADGRAILRAAQGRLSLLHAGERAQDCAFAETERRCRALYGLFRENGPAEPVPKSRVYVQRD